MIGTSRLAWAAPAALLCALPLLAHHSFSAEFDSAKTVTLRGVVSKVEWINPHIFIHVDVKDAAGKTTTWAFQSLPPLFFRGSGLTKDVLLSNKQEVTVTANPAKDGTPAYGFMTKLAYADGHVFSMSPQDADPSLEEGAEVAHQEETMAFVIANHRVLAPTTLAAALLIAPVCLPAQTNYAAEAAKNPGAATRPTPRMVDGHPDLTGVWHHFFGIGTIEKVGESFVVGGAFNPKSAALYTAPLNDPKPEYKPQFAARVKSLNDNQVHEDPALHCQPPGVPRLGPPHQIAHTPKQAVFLYADSTGNQWRVIPLDGRPHGTDPELAATFNGDSVGHWEGDTLVVDVTRLTDETWLGDNGLFHSRKLHVTERLQRVGDTIKYQVTAEDPEVLQKPWTLSRTLTLQPDALEEAAPCVDKDAGHYVTLEHHDNTR